MYRVGLESILGLTQHGGTFAVAPRIPASWRGFTIHWRHGKSTYEIRVENPPVANGGVVATLDGVAVDPGSVPLVDDGQSHVVEVSMGAEAAPVERV